MQLNISGHHLDLTPAIRDYVNDKVGRLERHYDHINNVQVILSVDKLQQKAEATIRHVGGETFATAESENLYAAIDSLSDKLDRQLLKHKEKTTSRLQGSGSR